MRVLAGPFAFFCLFSLALALRLPGLETIPLHQDEGLNAWLTLVLHWWGEYEYLPSDNHGPFLYYAGAALFDLIGPSELSLRLAPAIAGSLVPLALLPARRWFAGGGLWLAGLLLAIAPGLVYFSRAAIHEIDLVLFTALWAASLARFAARPSPGWAAACGAAAAGCFVTKETALITAGSLAVGVLAAGAGYLAAQPERERRARLLALLSEAARAAPVGLLVFAAGILVFYSSFFSHAAGLRSFFEAFGTWTEYATTGRNQARPFGWFWQVMASSQGGYRWLALPAVALACLRRDPPGLALAGWALASFLIYSALPYKTPWCVLQIDLPVFLLIGWAAGVCVAAARDAALRPSLRIAGLIACAAALAPAPGLLIRSFEDVRDRYDDPSRPYVYHHTQRSFFAMLQDLFGVAEAMPGADAGGPRVVNSGAPDPLRWYLHSRGWAPERTRFRENPAPPLDWIKPAAIVISSARHLVEVRRLVAATGEAWHEESYPTRPGVATTVFFRQAHWDRYQAAGGRGASPWPRPAVAATAPPIPAPDP